MGGCVNALMGKWVDAWMGEWVTHKGLDIWSLFNFYISVWGH